MLVYVFTNNTKWKWSVGQLSHLVTYLIAVESCVAMHFEKITHFEKMFQSALNLGPT